MQRSVIPPSESTGAPKPSATMRDLADHLASSPVIVATLWRATGSTPRETGAWMIVTPHTTVGTIGGGTAEWRAVEAARAMLASGEAHTTLDVPLGPTLDQCCGGHLSIALAAVEEPPFAPFALWEGGPTIADPLSAPVYVYGAGHVGLALARALAPLPFALTLIDGRAEQTWPTPPESAVNRLAIPESAVAEAPDTAIHLVMTHSHALDLEIVAAVLSRQFRFLGLIGSATKRALFERRLKERGLDTSRLTCPIGLPTIKGKDPGIIAASVAAQLLALPPVTRS